MPANTIADIRAARDEQLEGLAVSLARIQHEIQVYPRRDAYLQRLFDRQRNLITESNDVARAATDQILALPKVIAAGKTLVGLGKTMTKIAAQMPEVRGYLTKSAEALTVAKKFVDVVSEALKKSPPEAATLPAVAVSPTAGNAASP